MAHMTKKDYEAFALLLHTVREDAQTMHEASYLQNVRVETIDIIAEGLCYILALDNPAFQRARFLRAVQEGAE